MGVSKERIDFEGPSTLGEYYYSYNKVDIMLDTFPFPGGTTSFDALYMGVPIITLAAILTYQGLVILYCRIAV